MNNSITELIRRSKKTVVLITTATLVVSGFFVADFASAAATVTPAGGGTNISIDTTSAEDGSATFKSLNGPTIVENAPGEISVGTHTIILPSGWEFNINATVFVLVGGGDIKLGNGGNVTVNGDSVSFNVANLSTEKSSVVFGGLQVRPTGTTAPSTGNMTYSGAGIVGVTPGADGTNFGTLTTVAGEAAQLKIETTPDGYGTEVAAQQITSGVSITVYSIERDQFGNFRTNTSASWSLIEKTGEVSDGDLIPSGDLKSATFLLVI